MPQTAPPSLRWRHHRRRSLEAHRPVERRRHRPHLRVDGEYAYFAGPFNSLTATFSDPSLERLEERIVATNTL